MQDLIDDTGEIADAIIQRIANGFAAQRGQAKAEHKGQYNGGERVQQGGKTEG